MKSCLIEDVLVVDGSVDGWSCVEVVVEEAESGCCVMKEARRERERRDYMGSGRGQLIGKSTSQGSCAVSERVLARFLWDFASAGIRAS